MTTIKVNALIYSSFVYVFEIETWININNYVYLSILLQYSEIFGPDPVSIGRLFYSAQHFLASQSV